MKSKILVLMCLFLALPAFLHAQTAAEIEGLLETKAVSYGQAARFILEAADVSGFTDPVQAFAYAREQKWLPNRATPDSEARLSGISLLVMRSFDIKGGLFYSIAKNSHYAYRELVYQDIIQGRSDPGMSVSGSELLFMVNRVLPRFDDRPAAPAAPPPPVQAPRDPLSQEELMKEIEAQIEANQLEDTSVRITDEGVTISLSNIQFLANSAEIPNTELVKLRGIANILSSISIRGLLVSGHTALAGTEEVRLQTSLERAEAVKNFLVSLGVRRADEIVARGEGSQRPLGDNNTPQGMTLNRRVEFTILEQR